MEKKELRRILPKGESVFSIHRDGEWWSPTGYEVCFGDPDSLSDWWVEYENENDEGEHYYGR